jgi:hypothetical protein
LQQKNTLMTGLALTIALTFTSVADADQITFYNSLTGVTPGAGGLNLNNTDIPANEFIALATGAVNQIEFYTYDYRPAIQKNIGVEVFQASSLNPFATLLFNGTVATNSLNDEILNVSGLSLIAGDTYTLQLQNLQDTSGTGILNNYLNWSTASPLTSTSQPISYYENGSSTPFGTALAGSALITGTTSSVSSVPLPDSIVMLATGLIGIGMSRRKATQA